MQRDMLERVRQAEAEAGKIRQDAYAYSRDLIRQTKEDADDLSERSLQRARARAMEIASQAEQDAQRALEKKLESQRVADEQLKQAAVSKLDNVAAWIVERIVS